MSAKSFTNVSLKKESSSPIKSQEKWLSEDAVIGNLEVNCTTETKLRVFQFKFLHRRVATNDFLHKIGLKEVDSCSFCNDSTETLMHLFWYCNYTQTFWKNAFQWISQNLTRRTSPSLLPFVLA